MALFFLGIALFTAVISYSGIAGPSSWVAQMLFALFLVLFVFALLFSDRTYPAIGRRST